MPQKRTPRQSCLGGLLSRCYLNFRLLAVRQGGVGGWGLPPRRPNAVQIGLFPLGYKLRLGICAIRSAVAPHPFFASYPDAPDRPDPRIRTPRQRSYGVTGWFPSLVAGFWAVGTGARKRKSLDRQGGRSRQVPMRQAGKRPPPRRT
jgi:hypothetical protein